MQDIYDRKLSIYLTAGQDDDGKDIVKAKSFSNVRLDTTDEELSLVTAIDGYNEDTLNDVIYVRTGYRNIEQLLDEE